MLIDDEKYINRFVDEEEYPDMSQEEFNEENIMLHDFEIFTKNISNRIGPSSLLYYLDNLDKTNIKYWEKIFFEMIQNYKLSPLIDDYLDEKDDNFVYNIIRLIKDIKLTLLDMFEMGNIEKSISRNVLTKNFSNKFGLFFNRFLKYVSEDNFKDFIDVVYKEYKEDFVDI